MHTGEMPKLKKKVTNPMSFAVCVFCFMEKLYQSISHNQSDSGVSPEKYGRRKKREIPD